MTIRIHEADGTPYEHVLDIRSPFKRYEVPFNTKYKRVRRNTKRYLARQAAAQAAAEGDLEAAEAIGMIDMGFGLEVWENEEERDRWKVTDWTEEEEQASWALSTYCCRVSEVVGPAGRRKERRPAAKGRGSDQGGCVYAGTCRTRGTRAGSEEEKGRRREEYFFLPTECGVRHRRRAWLVFKNSK